jgi:cytochrome c553
VQSLSLHIVLLVLCVTLGTALGCGGAAVPEDGEDLARDEPVGEYMRDHFEQVRGVQVGVVRGDLEAVRAAAKWVATQEALEGMPEDWEPFIDQMRSAAADAIAAPDIAAAAVATAAMGSTCASCHEAMQFYPQFLAVAQPPESDETVPHMIGHMWAADRMWKGLVTPSAETWNDGVGALAGDPLDGESIVLEIEDPGKLAALAAKVHDLAAQGRAAAEMDARAEIYGEFLATCAECHQIFGIVAEQ